MQRERYNLIELARDLGGDVGDFIHYGADGKLTIHVIAEEWPGKKAGDSDVESDVIVDGAVDLLSCDLLKALGADHTKIRKVHTRDGDIVALDPIQERMPGRQYVTTAERDRLQEALKSTSQPTVAASTDASPPYLDPLHEYYSKALEAAISAWLALYVDGGFKKRSGGKAQIKSWLEKHRPGIPSDYARKGIATVVNPDKDGGNPRTKKH